MTLFSRKKADRSLAEETALVPADDENSRQQDADKHMISGTKKCQEDPMKNMANPSFLFMGCPPLRRDSWFII